MKEIDLTSLPKDSYIVAEQWGNCKVCGEYNDLRYGSCFACSEFVMSDDKEVWDIRRPHIRWNIKPQ